MRKRAFRFVKASCWLVNQLTHKSIAVQWTLKFTMFTDVTKADVAMFMHVFIKHIIGGSVMRVH